MTFKQTSGKDVQTEFKTGDRWHQQKHVKNAIYRGKRTANGRWLQTPSESAQLGFLGRNHGWGPQRGRLFVSGQIVCLHVPAVLPN